MVRRTLYPMILAILLAAAFAARADEGMWTFNKPAGNPRPA